MKTPQTTTENKPVMKSADLHEELRQKILDLPGVTERQNAGIHEDAFFVERTMFMHIHGAVTATFDCRKPIKAEFWRKRKHGHTDGRRKRDTSRSL